MPASPPSRPARRVRVAHMLPFPGVGGTEHATLRVAQGMTRAGFDSVAFCLDDAPQVRDLFAAAGIAALPWHRREEGSAGRRSFLYHTARLALTFRLKGVKLVSCADVAAVTRQVVLAARWAGAGLVCHVRNHNARLPPWIMEQLPQVQRYIFMSEATRRAFAWDVPRERRSVVYDGIDVPEVRELEALRAQSKAEVVRELRLPADATLVGMVARVEPQKDFETLARAAVEVVRELPTAHFVVVGGTDRTPAQREHYPRVQRTVDELGIAPHFHFVGFRNDVARYLRAMDVAALTTHFEGLPLVIWEAMAEGTPMVATAVDGIPEAIEDGVTGRLVPPTDPAAVARVLTALLRDPPAARALAARGRAHARQRFSTDAFVRTLAATYDEALREVRPRAR